MNCRFAAVRKSCVPSVPMGRLQKKLFGAVTHGWRFMWQATHVVDIAL